MNLIQKLCQTKNKIEDYIKENGMEKAVKKFGLNKLLNKNILIQYEGTELYHDDCWMVDKVYNTKGKCLGEITPLMSPYYKKLNQQFYGPCKNGNIILSSVDKNRSVRSYGLFDKNGNQLLSYGRFFTHCFVPDGVALMDSHRTYHNIVVVNYKGEYKSQPFSYLKDYI